MSLYKNLAKCIQRSVGNAGWGVRCLPTLYIPKAVYPVQRPVMSDQLLAKLGTPNGFGGYVRKNDDGSETRVTFGEVHGRRDPRVQPTTCGVMVTSVTQSGSAEDPSFWWVEVRVCSVAQGDEGEATSVDVSTPEWAWLIDVVTTRAAIRRWDDTIQRLSWCSDEVQHLYGRTEFWSKTTYCADTDRDYGVTFAVKRQYVQRFALEASRLYRALRREGIRARWKGLR